MAEAIETGWNEAERKGWDAPSHAAKALPFSMTDSRRPSLAQTDRASGLRHMENTIRPENIQSLPLYALLDYSGTLKSLLLLNYWNRLRHGPFSLPFSLANDRFVL
jgi:hypothetical protein